MKTNSENVFYNVLPYSLLIAVIAAILVALGKFLGLNSTTKYIVVIALDKVVKVLKIVVPFAIGIAVSLFFNPDVRYIKSYEICRNIKDNNGKVIGEERLERKHTDFGLYINNNEGIFKCISISILVFMSLLTSKCVGDWMGCPAALSVIDGTISFTVFMLYRIILFMITLFIICIIANTLSEPMAVLYNNKVDKIAGERYEQSTYS